MQPAALDKPFDSQIPPSSETRSSRIFDQPQLAQSTPHNPVNDEQLKENLNKLKDISEKLPDHLRKIHQTITHAIDITIQFLGIPLTYVGASILIYGLGQVFYTLLSTSSVVKIRQNHSLYHILIGSLFYYCGKEMMAGRGVNVFLSNLIWVAGTLIPV